MTARRRLFTAILILLVATAGCTNIRKNTKVVCGDGMCQAGEKNCIQDCGKPERELAWNQSSTNRQDKEVYGWSTPKSSLVDGRIITRKWIELEPEMEKFDWSDFDDVLEEARPLGKKVILWPSFLPTATKGQMPVPAIPQWLNAEKYTVSKDGASADFIIPWDETFQSEWRRFAQAMAERYDGDPNIRCIRLVETSLPGVTRYDNSFRELEQKGYTLEKQQNAFRDILNSFETAFKTTPICQNLNFPLGDPEFKETDYLKNHPEDVQWLDDFVDYAATNYHTILFFDGLVEEPTPKDYYLQRIFQKYQNRTVIGAAIPAKANDAKGTIDWTLEMADFSIIVAHDVSSTDWVDELKRWKETG